jgi:hypothetical protein
VLNAELIRRLYGVRVNLVETEHGPLLSPIIDGRCG